MFDQLPQDPVLCLSVVNTKLRDHYKSLELLCDDLQIDKEKLTNKLAMIDYEYDTEKNQFI